MTPICNNASLTPIPCYGLLEKVNLVGRLKQLIRSVGVQDVELPQDDFIHAPHSNVEHKRHALVINHPEMDGVDVAFDVWRVEPEAAQDYLGANLSALLGRQQARDLNQHTVTGMLHNLLEHQNLVIAVVVPFFPDSRRLRHP